MPASASLAVNQAWSVLCLLVQIGSFPQTAEVRRLRLQNKKGLLSDADYAKMISGHIGYAIGLQEAMDMDVLCHGEFERTDMVSVLHPL